MLSILLMKAWLKIIPKTEPFLPFYLVDLGFQILHSVFRIFHSAIELPSSTISSIAATQWLPYRSVTLCLILTMKPSLKQPSPERRNASLPEMPLIFLPNCVRAGRSSLQADF